MPNLRDLIHTIAAMAGKDVDKDKEDKIVNAVKNTDVKKIIVSSVSDDMSKFKSTMYWLL